MPRATLEIRDARTRRQVAADRVRGCRSRQCRVRCAARRISIRPARCARTARAYSCSGASRRRSSSGWQRASHRCGSAIRSIRRPRSGSLISEAHMDKVLGYIARGRAEGARLLVGGGRVTGGALDRGFFVAPTVFDECRRRHGDRARGDLRPGDVGAGVRHEEEVVRRANATEFGLAAGVFTRDLARAHRVIAQPAGGHMLDQPLQRHARRTAVRRRQAVRSRAARTAAPPSSTTPS